jgi:hypothetical protein
MFMLEVGSIFIYQSFQVKTTCISEKLFTNVNYEPKEVSRIFERIIAR